MTTTMHNPPHPGEVLREWLDGVTVTDAADRLGVTRAALSRVINGAAGISPDMDLRLSKALNFARRLVSDAGRVRHVAGKPAFPRSRPADSRRRLIVTARRLPAFVRSPPPASKDY